MKSLKTPLETPIGFLGAKGGEKKEFKHFKSNYKKAGKNQQRLVQSNTLYPTDSQEANVHINRRLTS